MNFLQLITKQTYSHLCKNDRHIKFANHNLEARWRRKSARKLRSLPPVMAIARQNLRDARPRVS